MIFPNYYQYTEVGRNKEIIPFTASTTPSIADYSIYSAKYGQYPTVELYFENENGNRAKHTALPEFILNSLNIIESINFGELADPISGFILLQ